MEHNSAKQTLSEKILAEIKRGDLRMRPKWHFLLRAAILFFGTILLLLCLFYIVSFIIFVLRQSGAWFVPTFGVRGWLTVLAALPWFLILLALLLLATLQILLHRYSFSYRRPLLATILLVMILTVLGGVGVSTGNIHLGILRRAGGDALPFRNTIYSAIGNRDVETIQRGAFITQTPDGFILETHRGETLSIVITPETLLPPEPQFEKGEILIVFGERGTSTVEAWGVRRVAY